MMRFGWCKVTGALVLLGTLVTGSGCRMLCGGHEGLSEHITVNVAVERVKAGFLVKWEMTNVGATTVRIPVRLDIRGEEVVDFPIAYIVPPADIMMVFGNVKAPSTRFPDRDLYTGLEYSVAFASMAPGASRRGTTLIKTPYVVKTRLEEEGALSYVASPFHTEISRGFDGPDYYDVEEKVVDKVSAIQVGVQYWPHATLSQIPPNKAVLLPLYRQLLVREVMSGEKQWYDKDVGGPVALSKRIPVEIPLEHAVKLYYSCEEPCNEAEAGSVIED